MWAATVLYTGENTEHWETELVQNVTHYSDILNSFHYMRQNVPPHEESCRGTLLRAGHRNPQYLSFYWQLPNFGHYHVTFNRVDTSENAPFYSVWLCGRSVPAPSLNTSFGAASLHVTRRPEALTSNCSTPHAKQGGSAVNLLTCTRDASSSNCHV
jgi:hypothetical protein